MFLTNNSDPNYSALLKSSSCINSLLWEKSSQCLHPLLKGVIYETINSDLLWALVDKVNGPVRQPLGGIAC